MIDDDQPVPQNVAQEEAMDLISSRATENRILDPERTPSPEFFTALQETNGMEISSNAVSSSRANLKRSSDEETQNDDQAKKPKTSTTKSEVNLLESAVVPQSRDIPTTSAVVIKPDPDASEVLHAPTSSFSSNNVVSIPIKPDPDAPDTSEATSSSDSAANPVVKADPESEEQNTNRATRESCQYGIRCYNRSENHRQAIAHPSDVDYRRPDFGTSPPNTPDCPFGAACYRRNPEHFQRLSHPPSSEFHFNRENF